MSEGLVIKPTCMRRSLAAAARRLAIVCFLATWWAFGLPLAANADQIWMPDFITERIQRSNLDGSGLTNVITQGIERPWSVAIDVVHGHVYWTEYSRDDSTRGGISRANLDGSGIVNILIPTADPSSPSGLALDLENGKMYWTDSWENSPIRRANLDGSGVEELAAAASARDIALDLSAGQMYWTNWLDGTVRRANLDGSEQEILIGGSLAPYGIALDLLHDAMYWTDSGGNRIRRADLDGSGATDVISVVNPVGLALDVAGGLLYWSEFLGDSAVIRRSRLDGSGIEDLFSSVVAPYDLTLVFDSGVPPSPISGPSTILLTAWGPLALGLFRRWGRPGE